MLSSSSSSSGTPKNSVEPVAEIGQVPFALCEIIALGEEAQQPDIVLLASSIFDLLLGVPALAVLELPPVAKEQIRGIINAHASTVAAVTA